jgi:hypothetical protein
MRKKNAHDAFTVLLRGAVNNRPRLSANNRVIRDGYRSTLVISDNPVDNQVIGGNVQLRCECVIILRGLNKSMRSHVYARVVL